MCIRDSHYNVAEADRNQAYRDAYTRLVIVEFGSGLHEEIREKVFGVADPPATLAEVLQAATAIENEKHAKATKLVVNLVDEEKDKPKPKEEEQDDPITVLKKQMEEVLAISRRGGQGFRGRGGRGRGQGSFSSYRCYVADEANLVTSGSNIQRPTRPHSEEEEVTEVEEVTAQCRT